MQKGVKETMSKLSQLVLALSLLCSMQSTLFAQRFTAYYIKIADDYDVLDMVEDKLFGKYADLIVEVSEIGKISFTRKTSYLPV